MRRLACVDIPALPLQHLLRSHPEWKGWPAAVVAEDRPTAPILFVNEKARRDGVLPGQRYAAGLALCRELRAGVVSEAEITSAVSELVEKLRRFTPDVEPGPCGVFWLDAHGLERLYPRLSDWARGVRDECAARGFLATVIVGFRRFGTYAVAKATSDTRVFGSFAEEDAAASRVSLSLLDIEPGVRDDLLKLGVRTVGAFLALPALGLKERFGETAFALHQLASGKKWTPLQPRAREEAFFGGEELGYPESDVERLLFVCKRILDPLLVDMAARMLALSALRVRVTLDDHTFRDERLRPASPTLDATQILNLLRLKLSTLTLTCGVVEVRLDAEGERAAPEQIRLLIARSRRDYKAMSRAFARLRAEFGEDAVVRPLLRDAHLPRAGYEWEAIVGLDPEGAKPRDVVPRPLVRRIYEKPVALPPRPRHEPDGWLLRGIEHGRVDRFVGPYVIAGGWWRSIVHREYYFAQTARGEVLWIYYDRVRQRWFLEGRVE